MLNKLRDILNTYTDEELKELDLWVDSSYKIEQIIVDEFGLNLITNNAEVKVNDFVEKEADLYGTSYKR